MHFIVTGCVIIFAVCSREINIVYTERLFFFFYCLKNFILLSNLNPVILASLEGKIFFAYHNTRQDYFSSLFLYFSI